MQKREVGSGRMATGGTSGKGKWLPDFGLV